MRHIFLVLIACLVILGGVRAAHAERPLKVVTTLSTFANLAEEIGGENVKTASVASPRFNPHFYEPRPSDVLKVKRADLFVHAGLDLEMWRWPLVDAAGNPAVRPGGSRELDLSQGIRLLGAPDHTASRAEGHIHIYGNPHYWLCPGNLRRMAQTIQEKLAQLDPAHAQDYKERMHAFQGRLDRSAEKWKRLAARIEAEEVVAYHDAWPYLARFLGVRIEHFLEPKPGIPPTPKQLVFLERHMKERGVRVVVQSTFEPKLPAQRLAEKTGAAVVLLCQNVKEVPECSSAIELLEYNVRQLAEALGTDSR